VLPTADQRLLPLSGAVAGVKKAEVQQPEAVTVMPVASK
jgi:hypothetical protein